jgi:hypothetical protein
MMAAEYHETGGLARIRPRPDAGPMMVEVRLQRPHGLVVTTTLDLPKQAFLYDHRIDGTPVLPGVMGMESFAEAAAWPPRRATGSGVEDVDVPAPR